MIGRVGIFYKDETLLFGREWNPFAVNLDGRFGIGQLLNYLTVLEMYHIHTPPRFRSSLVSLFKGGPIELPSVKDFLFIFIDKGVLLRKSETAMI